ncbi:MAG: hypothetical protein ACOYD0_01480 [Candidatus Nanopelagicales bacterium]
MTGLNVMAAESAKVTSWPGRLLLTVIVFALAAGVLLLMRRSWRRRAVRQGDIPALPTAPGDQELTSIGTPVAGTYLGSVTAGAWLDRIAAHGLANRGPATFRPFQEGLAIDRDGAGRLFIPVLAARSVRLDRGLSGRVYGRDGIIVVQWLWGEQLLESGLRVAAEADRKTLAKTLQEWVKSGLDRPDALQGRGSS